MRRAIKPSSILEGHYDDKFMGSHKGYMGGGLYAHRFYLPSKFLVSPFGGWVSPTNVFFPVRKNSTYEAALVEGGVMGVFGVSSRAISAFRGGWLFQDYSQGYGRLSRRAGNQKVVSFLFIPGQATRVSRRKVIKAIADFHKDVDEEVRFRLVPVQIDGEGFQSEVVKTPRNKYRTVAGLVGDFDKMENKDDTL